MKKLLILTILLLTVSAFKCGDGKAPKAPKLTVSCETEQKSNPTNGAAVCSRSGVSQAHLSAIDEELKQLSDDVAHLNYSQGRFPSNYVVFIYDSCVLSPESQSPSFLVDGGHYYDGTIYDQWNPKGRGVKDGESRIYAAEMVISNGFSLTNGYIVCNSPTVTQYFRDTIRFGPEHLLYFWNDRAKFNETANHATGGHPIIARTSALLSGESFPADVTDFVAEVKIKGGNIKLK